MARITATFRVEECAGQSRAGRQLVRLLEPVFYHVGAEDSDVVVMVPVGFETDFASVPRLARGLIPSLGPWARPAIIHDYLYYSGGDWGRFTRLECDRIFLEAMEVVKVPAWQRTIMFRAVRIGGGGGWGS